MGVLHCNYGELALSVVIFCKQRCCVNIFALNWIVSLVEQKNGALLFMPTIPRKLIQNIALHCASVEFVN